MGHGPLSTGAGGGVVPSAGGRRTSPSQAVSRTTAMATRRAGCCTFIGHRRLGERKPAGLRAQRPGPLAGHLLKAFAAAADDLPRQTARRCAGKTDMSETMAIGSTVTGIRCRIGRAEVALPLTEVGQIIEYSVFPLPLARRWIGGLGLYDERPLVSVALTRLPDRVRGQRRTAQGILLEGHAAGGEEVDWALEVDELGRSSAPRSSIDPPPKGSTCRSGSA